MWTSLNKKFYLILGIILAIGLIAGTVFVIMLDESTKEIISLNINEMIQNLANIKINNILIHLIIISCLIILSIFVIGAPLLIFFIFYNGFSLGFIITSITIIFGLKGTLFSVIYVLLSKGIYLLFSIIICVSLLKVIKCIIVSIKNRSINYTQLPMYFKKVLICFAIILLNDILLYFVGAKLINIFNFLLI